MREPTFHRPVLVEEVLRYLVGREDRPNDGQEGEALYLDGTIGGGGHAAAILEHCPRCHVVGLDRDPEALAAARSRLASLAGRVRLRQLSFAGIGEDPELQEVRLAGALLDLGVSSRQLDSDARGFTFRRGAALDMRMDSGAALTAARFLNRATRAELADSLRDGQAPRPAAIAARIVQRRAGRPLRTSDDLVAVLESVLARRSTHAEKARLFQALRIRINDEIGALRAALPAIRDLLHPGATIVVIAYHSLEDREVKHAFRAWSDPAQGLPPRLPLPAASLRPLGQVLTRKPVTAGAAEMENNPRARPARLRAWRRAA